MIPQTSTFIHWLLKQFHDGLQGGHSGIFRTLERIQGSFHCHNMRKTVQTYVAQCIICQTHKTSTLSPAGLLQPLPVLEVVWHDISMDFIEGLPYSNGVNIIQVIVDRLSKYGHFFGLKHPFTATDVAQLFVCKVIKLHDFLASIVSYRDTSFLSGF